jgi:hypothetical protein
MRTSRGTLQRACADLQAEVEARILEGFWRRIRRYIEDRELRERLLLARAAKLARTEDR